MAARFSKLAMQECGNPSDTVAYFITLYCIMNGLWLCPSPLASVTSWFCTDGPVLAPLGVG